MKKTIAELTTIDKLKELATESNRRLGKDIFNYNRIEIEESKPDYAIARVKVPTGQTRKIMLDVEADSLVWSCTCGSASGKDDVFCKHAVAVALKLAATD